MPQRLIIDILVSHGYACSELAIIQEACGLANQLDSDFAVKTVVWTTDDEELITSARGALVRAQKVDLTFGPKHLIVLGGPGMAPATKSFFSTLRRVERKGGEILLLSDAAAVWKLAHSASADFTSHWKLLEADRLANAEELSTLPMYAKSGRIATSAGSLATADAFLTWLVSPVQPLLAEAIARHLLMDKIRSSESVQPRSELESSALQQSGLYPIVKLMEENLEDPLPISEFVSVFGHSTRHMERKFKSTFGQSPAAFYRTLRLRKAHDLISETAMSIPEIAFCCGFGNGYSFSRLFQREFGVRPSELRGSRVRRTPALFHTCKSAGGPKEISTGCAI